MRGVPERWIRAVVVVLCAAGLPALGGCSSTSMTNTWSDPEFRSGPMKDVLVIAVRKDPARQRLWEDAFVAELTARGTKATAAYRMFPARPDTQQVRRLVREKGYDGVIVSARLDPTVTTREVAGYATSESQTEFNPWTGRYETYATRVTTPGYTETTTTQNFETRVWTTSGGGQLVWTGALQCTEAVDAGAIRDGVKKHIVPALERGGIVPSQPKK